MKKRIAIWIVGLVLAVLYIAAAEFVKKFPPEEKVKIVKKEDFDVYNDVENNGIFTKAFEDTKFSSTNKIRYLQAPDKNKCFFSTELSSVHEDNSVTLTAVTPLVVGIKNSSILQKYKENGLLVSEKEISNSIDDEIVIDFKKVVEAVNNGDNWSVFGGENKEIRIFVPEKKTPERELFYNFLVITLNNGSYPVNDDTLAMIKSVVNEFLAQPNCIETKSVVDELERINTINETDIYILFEADFMNSSIWDNEKLDVSIAYPNVSVVKHIYFQVPKEIYLQDKEECSKLFDLASTQLNYRISTNHSFTENKKYNVKEGITFIEIPEIKEAKEADNINVVMGIFACVIIFIVICLIVYLS